MSRLTLSFWALGFCISLLLAGCATTQTPAPAVTAKGEAFRVMTFNIHHGEGLDGKVDLERIAKLIVDERADLVAVQEVDKGLLRTSRMDMPAELARLTGMTCVFSNNFATQGGEYGNAILSKFPVLSTTNHALPKIIAAEPRGLLEAVVEIRGQKIRFMGTHLDHRREEQDRLAGVANILATLDAHPGIPAIIAGDFNASPESETYRRLTAKLTDAWTEVTTERGFTIPAANPSRRIDYIFHTQGSGFRATRAKVISSATSDHLPVIVEFQFD